jgi:pimeloyl-ACP methyl ester carboxylesterase
MGRLADAGWQAAGLALSVAPVGTLPHGQLVTLPGRGTTYVVDTGEPTHADPATAPTLILLHALACTGLLTWYPYLPRLRRHYRVVIFDQRWHGQGIRSAAFSLDDCADDVVAVADALGIDRFMVAGYSMGTLVGQLAWRRHPDRVAGVVLCAGAPAFTDAEAMPKAWLTARRALWRTSLRQRGLTHDPGPVTTGLPPDQHWVLEQVRSTSLAEIAGVGAALTGFDSRAWLHTMNVPVGVVVTARDRLLPAARQRWMAAQLPDATVHEAPNAGHAACVLKAHALRPAVLAACESVAARITGR